MSDYDRNIREPSIDSPGVGSPGFNSTLSEPAVRNRFGMNSSASWIGGIVVAILVIFGLGYLFSGPSTTMTEQRAAATDKAVGPPPAITARPVPSPSEQPK